MSEDLLINACIQEKQLKLTDEFFNEKRGECSRATEPLRIMRDPESHGQPNEWSNPSHKSRTKPTILRSKEQYVYEPESSCE